MDSIDITQHPDSAHSSVDLCWDIEFFNSWPYGLWPCGSMALHKARHTKFTVYHQRLSISHVGGLDVYAQAHNCIGHVLQLEHLRSRSGGGSMVLYCIVEYMKCEILRENPCGWWLDKL